MIDGEVMTKKEFLEYFVRTRNMDRFQKWLNVKYLGTRAGNKMTWDIDDMFLFLHCYQIKCYKYYGFFKPFFALIRKTIAVILLLFLLSGCQKLTDECDGKMNTLYTVEADCYDFVVEYTYDCGNTKTDTIHQFNWDEDYNDDAPVILNVKLLCTGTMTATLQHKGAQVTETASGYMSEIKLFIN